MPTPFLWNKSLGQYETTNGTVVPQAIVRNQAKRVIQAQTNKIERLSRSLRAGNLSLAEWEAEIVQALKVEYLAVGRAADGSVTRATIQNELDKQVRWLDRFATQIRRGEQKLDGRFLNRSQQYGKSAWDLYQQVYRQQRKDRGYTRERRVVNSTVENCDDCLDQQKLGWKPINTLKRLGDSACKNNCACHFEYDKGAAPVAPSLPKPVRVSVPSLKPVQVPSAPGVGFTMTYAQLTELGKLLTKLNWRP